MSGADSFRGFVGLLEEADELIKVGDEVDWNLEVGERTRAEAASRNRAVLFERVRGYENARILTNALGSPSRIGLALGLPAHRSFREVRGVVRTRLAQSVPPVRVLEPGGRRDTYVGRDLDLATLPVPWWSAEDAGRYLGTWHVNITCDPETGERNVGVYRMQLVDERTALVSASAGSHLVAQARRAEQLGVALEMVVAIGVAEPLVLAAGMAVAPGTDELSLAGALASAPILVTPGEVVGIDVPVDAEIVIEGRLLPGERLAEGPFVDYAGVPTANPRALVFEASLLGVRKNAIFRGAAIGRTRAEDHLVYALLASAGCLDFHGSRLRHHLQAVCLKAGWYRPFQLLGQVHPPAALRRRRR